MNAAVDLKTIEMELMDRVQIVNEERRRQRKRNSRRSRTSTYSQPISTVDVQLSEEINYDRIAGLPDWQPVEPSSKKERLASLSNNKEAEIHRTPVAITDEDMAKMVRLTREEILQMDRFKDYERGEPNNVLYVKNLSNAACEADLMALFGRVGNLTECKLMSRGKMRGQAFVTFSDTSAASKTLHVLHGLVFKGKPMVIQYGRLQQKGSSQTGRT